MNDTARVKLIRPIKVEERMVTEIIIRRPKPGSTELDQSIAMTATLCDLPPDAMDEMDAADFASISEVLSGFLPKAP
eukprot:gene26946-27173_t